VTIVDVYSVNPTYWTLYSISVVANAYSTTLSLAGYYAYTGWYVDDISVVDTTGTIPVSTSSPGISLPSWTAGNGINFIAPIGSYYNGPTKMLPYPWYPSQNWWWTGPWSYVGCYQSNAASQDLPYYAGTDTSMTIDNCAQNCAQMGYMYAGLQQGTLCYCGNSFGAYGASTQCNSRARGNPTQMGGGITVNSVYRTWRYQGCWGDSYTGTRDLPHFAMSSPSMTPMMCATACLNYFGTPCSYCLPNTQIYMGIQNGTYCFCNNGMNFGSYGTATNCNVPCGGNNQEMCGGSQANSVWHIGQFYMRYQANLFGYPANNYGGTPLNPTNIPAWSRSAAQNANFYATAYISNIMVWNSQLLYPHNPALQAAYVRNLTISASNGWQSALNINSGSTWIPTVTAAPATAANAWGLCSDCDCAGQFAYGCYKRNGGIPQYFSYWLDGPNAVPGQFILGSYGFTGVSYLPARAYAIA